MKSLYTTAYSIEITRYNLSTVYLTYIGDVKPNGFVDFRVIYEYIDNNFRNVTGIFCKRIK